MRVRIVVADASSLILMAKCSLLRPYGERADLVVARRVLQEVATRDLQRTYPDALDIARAVERGTLRVIPVRTRRKLPISLGPGEAATIRLFLQEDADLVLSDDGRAIRACRILELPFTTTPRVVVDLHRAGALSHERARHALEKLAVIGRYANEVIAAALNALEES